MEPRVLREVYFTIKTRSRALLYLDFLTCDLFRRKFLPESKIKRRKISSTGPGPVEKVQVSDRGGRQGHLQVDA